MSISNYKYKITKYSNQTHIKSRNPEVNTTLQQEQLNSMKSKILIH